MGDVSAEPSMEDILSSIKRIIAEEGDAATNNARPGRRAPRPPAPRADPAFDVPAYDDHEILELSDQVSADQVSGTLNGAAQDAASLAGNDFTDEDDTAMDAPKRAEPLLSAKTAQASRGSLEALSRMVVKPTESGADTLEGMVREMIRPMLRDWLDAKLPVIVETMVAQEIARITKQG